MTRATGSAPKAAAAAIGLVALLAMPSTAVASETSPDGWSHRSSESPGVGMDGWATRSAAAVVTDGFQVSQVQLPQATVGAQGFEVSKVELPQPAPITDGFEETLVALPKPMPVNDGWAVRSEMARRPGPAIDGWSYAALASAPSQPASVPPPAPRRSLPTRSELIVMALAVAVLAGGVTMLATRRHHHIPA